MVSPHAAPHSVGPLEDGACEAGQGVTAEEVLVGVAAAVGVDVDVAAAPGDGGRAGAGRSRGSRGRGRCGVRGEAGVR